ncbi:MAG: RHS repeat-associated core domain-containing protein, partial [Candidatus Brocadiae bacterium]|nr:RHS repeat-associated core domain-containing protein [Candidatus Brocadiia bacterium]
FQGRQLDPETGLYYFRNRYYSAEQGRFLQRDPLGYVDGLGLYEAMGGNSINFGDPEGLWMFTIRIPIGQNAGQALAIKETKDKLSELKRMLCISQSTKLATKKMLIDGKWENAIDVTSFLNYRFQSILNYATPQGTANCLSCGLSYFGLVSPSTTFDIPLVRPSWLFLEFLAFKDYAKYLDNEKILENKLSLGDMLIKLKSYDLEVGNGLVFKDLYEPTHMSIIFAVDKHKNEIWVLERKGEGYPVQIITLKESIKGAYIGQSVFVITGIRDDLIYTK